MPDDKMVVLAFVWIRIAGNLCIIVRIEKTVFTPGNHLVRITLVRHVINNFVFRRVKDIMQRERRLDKAEVRADVPADKAVALQNPLPDVRRQTF